MGQKRASNGVFIFGILIALFGINLFGNFLMKMLKQPDFLSSPVFVQAGISFVVVFIGCFFLVCGWGICTLKEWARKIVVGFFVLQGVAAIILSLQTGKAHKLFINTPALFMYLFFFLIFIGGPIFFLTRPSIKEQFPAS